MAFNRKAAEPAQQAGPAGDGGAPRENKRPVIPGRAVAYNRAGQPIQRAGAETGVNEFFIPANLPPAGWSWEWKRESNVGETDAFYMSKLHQVGWEPVMYESYPGVFAPEYDEKGQPTKGPVRRKGLILMERAAILTQEAFEDETRRADERVGNSRKQYSRLNTQGTSTAEFDSTAQAASYIRQTREVVADPNDQRAGYRQKVE